MNFKDWYETKLVVTGVPHLERLRNYDVVINVSDEFFPEHCVFCNNLGKQYNWFPMGECTDDMGLNSIYAAMVILYSAFNDSKKVLLHCHAGANRSPTVQECFYFCMTNRFIEKRKEMSEDGLKVNFISNHDGELHEAQHFSNSRLINNIEFGHLPSVRKMMQFLKNINKTLQDTDAKMGGMLDYCKITAQISHA